MNGKVISAIFLIYIQIICMQIIFFLCFILILIIKLNYKMKNLMNLEDSFILLKLLF